MPIETKIYHGIKKTTLSKQSPLKKSNATPPAIIITHWRELKDIRNTCWSNINNLKVNLFVDLFIYIYIYIYIILNRGIIYYKLNYLDQKIRTSHDLRNHWTAVETLLLYNCGGIFLYYHFLFYISCLSVYLGCEPFGLVHGLVRCTHWVQVFTRVQGGCDNLRCHNKNSR